MELTAGWRVAVHPEGLLPGGRSSSRSPIPKRRDDDLGPQSPRRMVLVAVGRSVTGRPPCGLALRGLAIDVAVAVSDTGYGPGGLAPPGRGG